jgi:DNA-directed RNA polymerase subunit omega
MIEALKGEEIVNKVGGRFKLTALIQARVRELMDGARPLVERKGRSDIEVAIAEIAENKIAAEFVNDAEIKHEEAPAKAEGKK